VGLDTLAVSLGGTVICLAILLRYVRVVITLQKGHIILVYGDDSLFMWDGFAIMK